MKGLVKEGDGIIEEFDKSFARDVDLAIAVATDAEAESVAGNLIRAGFFSCCWNRADSYV